MPSTSASTAQWLTKKMYRSGLDKDALCSSNALLSHVEHEQKFATPEGLYVNAPSANGQGLGPTNQKAYTARTGNKGNKFLVPQRRMLHFGELDADIVRNTEAGGDEQQFTNILVNDIDGATENFGQEINQRLYGDSLGGRCFATFAAAVATLTDAAGLPNPEAAAFFEEGMLIALYDQATGLPRNTGTAVTVQKVDTILGTVTASTSWTTTISAGANGDALYRAGFNASETGGLASLDGLNGWVPVTPVANFLGVDQTINRARSAGVYADISGFPIRPGFIRAQAVLSNQLGNRFDAKSPIFMNPSDKAEIVQSVEAVRVVDMKLDTKYGVGVSGVEVLGSVIISDRHCPVGSAYMVPKKAFTLGTAGNQPKIDEIDGRMYNYSRQTGTLEFVLALDGNSYSRAISSIARFKLPVRSL